MGDGVMPSRRCRLTEFHSLRVENARSGEDSAVGQRNGYMGYMSSSLHSANGTANLDCEDPLSLGLEISGERGFMDKSVFDAYKGGLEVEVEVGQMSWIDYFSLVCMGRGGG